MASIQLDQKIQNWREDVARLSDLFVQIMYKTLSQRVISDLTESEVTLPQLQAMRYIMLHDHVLMGTLAEGLDISYPSASNMINRLERKGLVERLECEDDHREVEVGLTLRGRELSEQVEETRVTRLAEVFDQMDPQQREALMEGLRQFIVMAVNLDPLTAGEICLKCGAKASMSCPIAESSSLAFCK